MSRPISYGHDKPTALILKKMARERQHRPDLSDFVGSLPQEITPLRSFIVYLDDVLPPATEDPNDRGTWVFEEGSGVVWGRNRLPNEENSQDPNYTINNTWSPLRDENNNCLRKRVYNPTPNEAPPCVPLQAVQDIYGDLFLVEVVSTASTSTTTPAPLDTLTPFCEGQCKWVWHTSDNYWHLDSNGCETTTTTSTTTTTPDPNIPFNPCVCDPSFTPNTTPVPQTYDCNCAYPTFCGTTDGDCTYTICGTGYDLIPSACPGTTTSTTTTTTDPSTTTTTLDCNTTTVDPNCELGCSWIHIPVQGIGYRLVENNCLGDCYCPYPDNIPEECVLVTENCVPIPPGGTTCEGICDFYWAAPLQTWYLLTDTCYGSPHCVCRPPSMDGGAECGTFSFGCEARTTTTADPCPTSTTTTSTTPGPCQGVCEYGWDETPGSWYLISSTCTTGCECAGMPPFPGNDECERQVVDCVGDGTTSTTTTSTTTTTPVPCYCFDCYMQCVDDVWTSIGTPCGFAAGPSCVCYFDETNYSGASCNSMVDDYLDGKCRVVGQPWQSDDCTSTTTSTTTTTTEPPIGACCYSESSNSMCSNITEAACNLLSGSWMGADTNCVNDPCQFLGACCTEFGCQLFTEEGCIGASGTFLGLGEPCVPDPCTTTTTTTTSTTPAPGVCCIYPVGLDPSCVNTHLGHPITQSECETYYAGVEGTWRPGAVCEPLLCNTTTTTTTTEAPMGACCCLIGDCIGDMIEADCVGCTWYEGETCGSFSCPEPTTTTTTTTSAPMGACCCQVPPEANTENPCLGNMTEADCLTSCLPECESCVWYEGENCSTYACP